MQISDIMAAAEDQNRGKWFEFPHPVTGELTGLAMLVAGPDSKVQADAMAQMVDDLADVADNEGRVSGADRAAVHRRFLARCVLDWRASEDGKPVAFSTATLIRLLGVAWVKSQLDAYAVSRMVYSQVADRADDGSV